MNKLSFKVKLGMGFGGLLLIMLIYGNAHLLQYRAN